MVCDDSFTDGLIERRVEKRNPKIDVQKNPICRNVALPNFCLILQKQWNVMPLLLGGSYFYFFTDLYCANIGLNAQFALQRWDIFIYFCMYVATPFTLILQSTKSLIVYLLIDKVELDNFHFDSDIVVVFHRVFVVFKIYSDSLFK